MNLEEIKEHYDKDIELSEAMLNSQIMSLPKIIAKYQYYFYDLLKAIAIKQESLDKLYYDSLLEYKYQQHELSNIKFTDAQIGKILKITPLYRQNHLVMMDLESELKLVEEMMSNIKNIGFSINNKVTLEKIRNGVV